jgi:hypothetical protein
MAFHPQDSRRHDPRRPVCDPADPYVPTCPLGAGWQQWDLGNCWTDGLPGDAQAIADRGERVRGVRLLGTLNARFVWAFDDPSRLALGVGGDLAPNQPWNSHIHAEFPIDGHQVHIDWITATRFGPGRSLTEVRIFIDGKFAGRAGYTGSSLGGGGSSFPAVALIGNGKALVLTDETQPMVAFQDASSQYNRTDAAVQRPLVRLWTVQERTTEKRSKRSKNQRPPFATERDRRTALEFFERLMRDEELDAKMPDIGGLVIPTKASR